MSTDLSHFKDAFFEESQEHLTTIEEGLLQLEQRPGTSTFSTRISAVRIPSRATAACSASQPSPSSRTKWSRSWINFSSQMVVTVEVTDLLLQSLDCLKTLIDCAKSGEAPNDAVVSGLGPVLEACQNGASAAKQEASPPH